MASTGFYSGTLRDDAIPMGTELFHYLHALVLFSQKNIIGIMVP
jgi:hypothetical protein